MSIHPTALIADSARIGANVTIGPYVTIYDNVVIGNDCTIDAYCELGVENSLTNGDPLIIGAYSHIRSHSIFYAASTFDEKLITGHRVVVREKTKAGKNFQIGTLADIQGHCEIGNHVRTHSNVFIAPETRIGNFVWMFPFAVLTNDPHPPSEVVEGVIVEDFAVIAAKAVVLPGATISKGCLIGANSCIRGNTREDTIYYGSPAKEAGSTSKLQLKDGSGNPAYPWRYHFKRGYPESVVRNWIKESQNYEIRRNSYGN